MVFDEVYYALDAADLLRHGVESSPAHPPLAKWFIAAGIRVFGFTPVGWRSAALLAGVALVLVTWLAARKVTDHGGLAFLAGFLVALDGIAFVTGRLALLDVFVAVATTGAAWCVLGALVDRDDPERLRRWRWAVAVLLGLGTAMKWGAVWTWPVAAVVLVSLERRAAAPGAPRRRVTVTALAVLALVPVGLYVASYAPWFAQAERTRAGLAHCGTESPCQLGVLERFEVFVDHQRTLVDFHAGLDTDNPEAAPAWAWAGQTHPANLFSKPCLPGDDVRAGVARRRGLPRRRRAHRGPAPRLANPVSWFAGLLALGVPGGARGPAGRRRRRRAAGPRRRRSGCPGCSPGVRCTRTTPCPSSRSWPSPSCWPWTASPASAGGPPRPWPSGSVARLRVPVPPADRPGPHRRLRRPAPAPAGLVMSATDHQDLPPPPIGPARARRAVGRPTRPEWLRVARAVAIGLYAGALVAWWATKGIPLDREQIILWLAAGPRGAVGRLAPGRALAGPAGLAAGRARPHPLRPHPGRGRGPARHLGPRPARSWWSTSGSASARCRPCACRHGCTDPGPVQWWEVPVTLTYISHFFVPFVVAAVFWLRDRERYWQYIRRFVSLSFLAAVTFVLFPAVPPWLASRTGELDPLVRTAPRGWSEAQPRRGPGPGRAGPAHRQRRGRHPLAPRRATRPWWPGPSGPRSVASGGRSWPPTWWAWPSCWCSPPSTT